MGKGSHVSLADLLRILDGYSLNVPTKGDFTRYHPDTVYVTTNYHPYTWYDYSKRMLSYKAIARRFTEVHRFYETCTVIDKPGTHSWEKFWQPNVDEGNPGLIN